ncbi:hypothetical protein GP486_003047 [Trichoglossum hirsutum]|uniref:Signal peptidase subunit 3 n=1 Tax=Trichoglossum hirsutum TaxID=265104 RepID=A0A9P8LDT3_9PEZI|nr:hypothetical protein GP486_003047 [Trichoglossum hirsutum]
MHSTVVRAQNIFGLFTTVTFVVSALIGISVLLYAQTPSANIQLRNIQVVKGRPHYYSSKKEEYAHIKFDLDAGEEAPWFLSTPFPFLSFPPRAPPRPGKLTPSGGARDQDLSSVFNWNTKQVFVYVVAKWPTAGKPGEINEAVIWDQIIPADPALNPNVSPERRRRGGSAASKADRGLVRLRAVKSKYQITDVAGKMAEKGNATLELGWNVQPWVGALTWTTHRQLGGWKALRGGRSEPFDFPGLQVKKKPAAGRSN